VPAVGLFATFCIGLALELTRIECKLVEDITMHIVVFVVITATYMEVQLDQFTLAKENVMGF
jgi:hypothetical protein